MKKSRVQIVARIAPEVRRDITRAVIQKHAPTINALVEEALKRHLGNLTRRAPRRAVRGPIETKGR